MAVFRKTAQAEEDLVHIWLYIAEDFRYLPVGRYLMLYRVITDGIELVRVVPGMRLLSTL